MLVSIGTFNLCDGTRLNGVGLTNLRFKVDRKIQVAEVFRAPAVLAFDRGNRQTTASFEISRTFPDLGSADAFTLTHEESIPTSPALVTFIAVLTNGQKVLRYLPSGTVSSVELASQIGLTTRHQYSIVGGIVTSVAPNLWGAAQI
jgi:hypothetical protein